LSHVKEVVTWLLMCLKVRTYLKNIYFQKQGRPNHDIIRCVLFLFSYHSIKFYKIKENWWEVYLNPLWENRCLVAVVYIRIGVFVEYFNNMKIFQKKLFLLPL
jgi:hypothetical protein